VLRFYNVLSPSPMLRQNKLECFVLSKKCQSNEWINESFQHILCHLKIKQPSLFHNSICDKFDTGLKHCCWSDGWIKKSRSNPETSFCLILSLYHKIFSCNWVFSSSNWQKVQLITDLLKHRTRYLYAKETGSFKQNETERVIKSRSD